MNKAKAGAAALAFLAIGAVASEGQVDYRQHVMAAVGGHMQALADIVRGKVEHAGHAAVHANALADLAEIAPTLFPAGAEGGDTLPAVWENPEDFQAKLAAFREAAGAMRDAAASGDPMQVGMALRDVGQACKGCHDDYRAE